MQYIIAFLVTGVIFAIIDTIWLTSTARFYKKQLGGILREKPNFVAAVLFYILYIAGVVIFVLVPALEHNNFGQAGILGALFGLVAYATYDLTNLATLKKWPVTITVIDLIWGMAITCISSLIAFSILKGWMF